MTFSSMTRPKSPRIVPGAASAGLVAPMSDSTAYVTADLPEGGQMKYKVSLVRDMIGWKVANVDYYASSQY